MNEFHGCESRSIVIFFYAGEGKEKTEGSTY